MAQFWSNIAFNSYAVSFGVKQDVTYVDLHDADLPSPIEDSISESKFDFYSEFYFQFDMIPIGVDFSDIIIVDDILYYNGYWREAFFAASQGDISFEGNSATSGVFDYLGETYEGYSDAEYAWFLADLSVSAFLVDNAVSTSSTADDIALFASLFGGNDQIYLSEYADSFDSGSGDDVLYGFGGNDTLIGADGNDTLYSGAGNDKAYGGTGNDVLYLSGGDDTVDGGLGDDWLYAWSTNSKINLAQTTAQNTGYGVDIITNIENVSGGSGVDELYGTSGSNTLLGNNGNDLLYGQGGNDTLNGGGNNDKLYGGVGNDILKGDGGNDSLWGGAGKDSLTGGAGNDRFMFNTVAESGITATASDVITDFVRGQDKINLSAIDAFAGSANVNDTFIWKGTAGFNSTTKGEVRYEKFNKSGTANDYTMVYIDNDNDSTTEMAIRLTGLHNLTQSDFVM